MKNQDETQELENMVSNITTIYNQCLPTEYVSGIAWYETAHELATRITEKLGVSDSIACKAIASLSPQTSWLENVRVVNMVVNHVSNGGTFETFDRKGIVALPINIEKCFAILSGDESALHGQKVTSFADNIQYLNRSSKVTIDVWAYRIALGLINVKPGLPHAITPKRYTMTEKAYKVAADRLGVTPVELQAIVWVIAHRLENKPL